MKTTIITVPCFNEQDRLPVESFRNFLQNNDDVRFLFVNDGSRDKTQLIIDGLKTEFPDRVMSEVLPENRGKAEAVRQGLLKSIVYRPDIVGFWDADLSTPLSAIRDLLRVFERNPGVRWVFGARVQLLGRHIIRRNIRHYPGRIFATLASMALKENIYDTQCGAKVFICDDNMQAVIQQPFISRWAFDVEMIARLKKQASKDEAEQELIYEYPLKEWIDQKGSKVRWTDFFTALHDLLRIAVYYGSKTD